MFTTWTRDQWTAFAFLVIAALAILALVLDVAINWPNDRHWFGHDDEP